MGRYWGREVWAWDRTLIEQFLNLKLRDQSLRCDTLSHVGGFKGQFTLS